MVLDDGSMRLVDWDVAALIDPLQDIGACEVFEMMWGDVRQCAVRSGADLGIADSLRWALIGWYCDAVKPGTHEYSKFSDWQYLRARAGLRDSHFDDRVRNI